MTRFLIAPFVFLMMTMFAQPYASAVIAEDWQFGIASVDITPPVPLPMAGYGGRDHQATQQITPLWCKVLVLESADGSKAVLITLDLVGIERRHALRLRQAIADQHQLELSAVAIACSHTHTGPVVGRNLEAMHYWRLDPGTREAVDRYATQLDEQVQRAVEQAFESRQPGSLAYGMGHCDLAVNRRNNVEANVRSLRSANQLVGPVDHRVPVLAVRDASGDLQGVVFGYACHATVLSSNEWSGDYPGFAQQTLQERFPGVTAMFWAGCGADQNPLPRREVALAQHYGERLATAVEAVLRTHELVPIASHLSTESADTQLAINAESDLQIWRERLNSSDAFERGRAESVLANLDEQGRVPTTYPYPISIWKLGVSAAGAGSESDEAESSADPVPAQSVSWVFLGGEVVVDYALRLAPSNTTEIQGAATIPHENSASQTIWVTAYANDVMAYIPSRRVLAEGGYEGGGSMLYYGLPGLWTETVEQQIVEQVESRLTR